MCVSSVAACLCPQKTATLRTDSRHVKKQCPQSDTLRNVFFSWPGDLDLVPVQLIRREPSISISNLGRRCQRASRLINSTWRRRIVRAVGVTSRLLAIVHARRPSLPPSPFASLVLSTELLPSLMLLLSLELPRFFSQVRFSVCGGHEISLWCHELFFCCVAQSLRKLHGVAKAFSLYHSPQQMFCSSLYNGSSPAIASCWICSAIVNELVHTRARFMAERLDSNLAPVAACRTSRPSQALPSLRWSVSSAENCSSGRTSSESVRIMM